MHLHDKVTPLRQRPGAIGRLHERRLSRRPSVHVLHGVVGHRGKSWLTVCAIELSRHALAIDADAGVMEDARVIGPQFDPADVLRGRNRHRNREVPEEIFAGGRQGETLGCGDNEIGFAELPALRQLGQRRPCSRIALRCASFNPLPNQLDLIVAKTALVIEIAIAVFGQPRWHRTARHRLNDLTSSPANRLVLEDAERGAREANWIRRSRCLIDGPMTARAVLIENRCDVVIEGRRRAAPASRTDQRENTRGTRAASFHFQMTRCPNSSVSVSARR